MAPHRPDLAGLAVDERLDATGGKVELLDHLDELVGVVGLVLAVHPRDGELAGAVEVEPALGVVDDQHGEHRATRGDPFQRRGDGGQRALVADHQVPVGLGIGGVAARGPDDLEAVTGHGVTAHRPAKPASPWTTKSMVSRPDAGSQARIE